MNKFFFPATNPFGCKARQLFSTLAVCLIVSASGFAASNPPDNIDTALKQVLAESQPAARVAAPSLTTAGQQRGAMAKKAVRDAQGRVRVNIHLNGSNPLSQVRDQLTAGGANVFAASTSYRNGMLSAFVPVSKIAEFAGSPGVLSMVLSRQPVRNIGNATSGGVFTLRTDVLNAPPYNLNGAGLNVGVLSDSYDVATTDTNGDPLLIHAAQDVASGDLPGTTNPNGHTNPVVVLDELNPVVDGEGFDEGRAMLQIIHDIAPGAKLAFATAFHSEVSFADNIRSLRAVTNCDVICDDVFYLSEPFFSDGIIAQAVDEVATSTVLSGNKVSYFSSAGNQQGGGYTATFKPVANSTARAGMPGQNVKLNTLPPTIDTTGGFHNFNPEPGGPPDISQSFPIFSGSSIDFSFQWNDPFDKPPGPAGVTTDYNILIFDEAGNYLSSYSGTDDNFATKEPIESITVENPGPTDTHFQVVIARAGNSPAVPVARKLRYIAMEFGAGSAASEYIQPNAPATFGHNSAIGAISTAAYVYDDNPSVPVAPPFTPFIEDFTSQGPATIDFDASGNRLSSSEIRQKPEIATPDGGNNTFFGFDYEGDGLPNFFGTSAAAPHGAGVAALMLQGSGGPGTITPPIMKSRMEASVPNSHDVNPFFAEATASKSGSSVKVTGAGNVASSQDTNFFTVTFAPSKAGESLSSLTLNLTNAGLKFDSSKSTGFPFTLGRLRGISASNIKTNIRADYDNIQSITLMFNRKAFTGGVSVSFGIDRDYIGDGAGNGADLMEGGNISAVTSKRNVNGIFSNLYGTGYTIVDGFGLIDAVEAVAP